MATIEVDGRTYEVQDGSNLLAECLSLGLDLPYFCWHPAMGSVGACRQCAVIQYKDAEDTRGRLVMACITPVADNLRISLNADVARQFRADNIELLMINHPHDCPVCEEGGECHLQDMTLMTGHTSRRYRGRKRTHRNQYLGPFVNHEMNRCIACYRCVRFYNDYAGGADLEVLGIHNNVYFGRHEDGTLESEFSGNLVEVCPTGVFTDKPFSDRYTRKWDLQTAPSVCVHCSLGCNTTPGERYGELRRIVNRYHGDVNGYFLCDRGRFGYGFVNSDLRGRFPRIERQPVAVAGTAIEHFRTQIRSAKGIIGIGSPRASLEANFTLRELVGETNFFLGLDETEHDLLESILGILANGGIHTPTLRETEQADAVLILGEDVTHSAPRLALSLRQSVRNATFDLARQLKIPRWLDAAVRQLEGQVQSPLFIASVHATRLHDSAAETFHGSPEAIARLGFAIAHSLNPESPLPSGLDEAEEALAALIAGRLREAKRPLIVSGTSCASLAVVQAAYNIARALPAQNKGLLYALPEANSLGLTMIGGRRLKDAFARVQDGSADTMVILENDLYRRAPAPQIDAFLDAARHVAVIDHLENPTTAKAGLLLPAATFAESEGTLVNNEGRAQCYFPVYPAQEPILAGWEWLIRVMDNPRWHHFRDLTSACAAAIPALAGIERFPAEEHLPKIPRQPHRYSGRTAMHADVSVIEPPPPQDCETPFAFSMEGDTVHVPPALLPVVWAPGWNSNQAINKFQDEVAGPLRSGNPGIRLIQASGMLPWFDRIPPAFVPERGFWRIVRLPNIFAGEELSAHSAPVAERFPDACVFVNPEDAETLAVSNGDSVEIRYELELSSLRIPVRIDSTMPAGLLGITAGLPPFRHLPNGARVALIKAGPEAPAKTGENQ
ncbi:NADH-quinone oxidoreductase subunit NuoG [Candidatus Methylomicrobium oryzae]|uniref:NADH-quinone oxidoreductase subunit NuoG n=1 Tax=Candidatus Methylomicrobium oryzae TaxID=2802053 RepID=UPI00192204CF|nr:NADH-quinone oxidoreductase subunit NuoG [Methylomicrobium sp. RS1]MBL1263013.1 NADH-quinone oxidoreductase subunit NuoG [Methylomicrobium sp. RS1]